MTSHHHPSLSPAELRLRREARLTWILILVALFLCTLLLTLLQGA